MYIYSNILTFLWNVEDNGDDDSWNDILAEQRKLTVLSNSKQNIPLK